MIIQSLSLSIILLIIHFIIFKLAEIGILGINLQIFVQNILKKPSLFIYCYYIIFIFLLIIFIKNNQLIYCDNSLNIETKVDKVQVIITRDGLDYFIKNFGITAAFITGLRVGSDYIINSEISLLLKVIIIGSFGIGFSFGYQIFIILFEKISLIYF